MASSFRLQVGQALAETGFPGGGLMIQEGLMPTVSFSRNMRIVLALVRLPVYSKVASLHSCNRSRCGPTERVFLGTCSGNCQRVFRIRGHAGRFLPVPIRPADRSGCSWRHVWRKKNRSW